MLHIQFGQACDGKEAQAFHKQAKRVNNEFDRDSAPVLSLHEGMLIGNRCAGHARDAKNNSAICANVS